MELDSLVAEIALSASELKVSNANEATTRLKLIDTVIFGLLGWGKADVRVEERVSEDGKTGFFDYILSSGTHSLLIEAKRISRQSNDLPNARKASLGAPWAKRGDASESIRQARDYARTLGVGFCAVTNGISWLIFPVNRRDQVPFEESFAILFSDIVAVLQNDPDEFSSLLSRQEVISTSLERELLGSDRDQTEARRLNDIYDRSFSKVNRSSIFHAIEREIITAFSEELLSDNVDVLEKCYVQTPERTRFDSRIRMHLAGREQVLRTRPIRPVGRRNDANTVKGLLTESRLATRPIALLTVGLVGAGKTTFLNYVSGVSAAQHFSINSSKPTGCWIWVDFRDYSQAYAPLFFIIDKVYAYITSHPWLSDYETCLRHAYEQEISALTRGPLKLLASNPEQLNAAISQLIIREYADKEPYVRRIASYSSKLFPIFLVVDNVDQIEDPEKQASIFLEATGLARSIGCNLVLAMRDSTYVQNRSSAVFDAFDFDAVYIDPPSINSVLSKRFAVAAQLLSNRAIELDSEQGYPILVKDARLIVDMLSQSVLGTEVGNFIEVAATGDTRLALQMTRQFLQYGYSSTSKAVEIYQRTGKYFLPPHEALRAIMLGNQNVYREDFSVFGNPFDAHLGRTDLQFLRVYIMGIFVTLSSEREFEGLALRNVIEQLEEMGIGQASSRKVIDDLVRFRYLFSRSHQQISLDSILIPSRFCGLIIRELIGRLMFVETTMFDTFVADDAVWAQVKTNMAAIYRQRNPARKFAMRREVVTAFFDYCETGTERLVQMARQRGLDLAWCSNPLSKIKISLGQDMDRASRSAERIYGPIASGKSSPTLL